MTHEHIATAEDFYAALDARDLDALAGLLTEDVVFVAPSGIPFGGRLQGRDAVRGFVTDAWGFFEDYANVRERMVAHEDRVLVYGHHASAPGGVRRLVPYQSVLTFRDGLIASFAMQVDAGLVVKSVAAELAAEPGRPATD
jgi:ketosteroid isomerase-like protein